MQGLLAAGRAKLFYLKATLDGLLILACVVVHLLTDGALQFDQIVLGHIWVVVSCQWLVVSTDD